MRQAWSVMMTPFRYEVLRAAYACSNTFVQMVSLLTQQSLLATRKKHQLQQNSSKIELSCRSTMTRREDNRNRSLSTEWEKRVSTCSPEIQKLLHPTAAHQTAAGRSVEVGSIISSDQSQTSYKHFSCSFTLTCFT